MNIKEEQGIKKEFQLERAILFTDAVFAIILTIMVLDIKLPEGIRHAGESEVITAFKEIAVKFIAYGFTFFLVGLFWLNHLNLFKYLKKYDAKLITLNLIFLFCASLFPFAVSLVSGNISSDLPEFTWSWVIYASVIYSTAFTQALISRYLIINKHRLCHDTDNLEQDYKWKTRRLNLFTIPLLIIISIMIAYLRLNFIYVLIIVTLYEIINYRLNKRYYPYANKMEIIAPFKPIRSIKTKQQSPEKLSKKNN